MKCGKSKMIPNSTNRKRTFKRCWSTIWNQFLRSSLEAWVRCASSKTKIRKNKNMGSKVVSMFWKNKRLFKLEFVQTQRWNNSTRDKSLIIWKLISNFNKTNVCLSWQTQIFIQKMVGHSFSAWRSKVGEFVSRVTHDIIPTLLMKISQCVILPLKLQEKFNIELSKQHVTNWLTFYP